MKELLASENGWGKIVWFKCFFYSHTFRQTMSSFKEASKNIKS